MIVVSSGKGGTGKSVVSGGLGTALCRLGKKVLLIDSDEGMSSLDLILGMSDAFVYDFADLVHRHCTPAQAIRPVSGVLGLFLITAPSDIGQLPSDKVISLFSNQLAGIFDYVIIDSPAGVGSGFIRAVNLQKNALIVVTPDPVSIRDAARVQAMLGELGVKNVRMIINKFETSLVEDGELPNIDDVIDHSGIQLIGVIPNDVMVLRCYSAGIPVTSGRAAAALGRIAGRLEGSYIPLPPAKKI
ncbi:MAG: P-loop NTPase [Oscillospiraceae bacterium]|nr:P-loop NTPase [Oscillospiraceae bacterium]